MLFSSLIFMVVFLPCVLIIYYGIALLKLRISRKLQNVFLLIASLGFYAWGEPWFVLVMVLSIVGNWIFGLLVSRFRKNKAASRGIISLMLAFNLTIIFIFKYLCFVITQINALLGTDIAVPEIALPIGISFFTFQAISYVIDVYREKGQLQKNLLNVGLYISFFPQLIAGPIVRYETISDQIMNRRESWDSFSQGASRFIVGMCKKVLLANNFALIANQAFSYDASGGCSVLFAWLGAIAYTFQIYFDFSGYSDMAIGLGKMFGFHFLENFNYPYISKSVSEFWRRWHISLGSWFRDYVYFPLGGSRVESKARLVFNLFVVWLLTGIWHGANWTFISWGLMYFVLISVEKLTRFEKRSIPAFVKWLYTMFFVVIGWVFFRADSMAEGLHFVMTMLGLTGAPALCANFTVFLKENIFYLIAGIVFSTPAAKQLRALTEKHFKETNPVIALVYSLILTAGLLLSMAYLVKGAYNPFIYFNF